MSLETEVAALVGAAEKLTSSVDGKMKEIDKSVANAVEGIPAAVRNNMGRTVYVDQKNGSDGNSGDSSSNAYKSIQKVAQVTPAGASVYIRLVNDYVFDRGEQAGFTAAQVMVGKWGDARPKLKFSYVMHEGNYQSLNFYASRNCLFNFIDLNLEWPDVPTESGTINARSCVIGTNTSGDVPTPLSLRFANTDLSVPGGAGNPFSITPGNGIVILSTLSFSVTKAWVDSGRVFQRNTASLSQKVQLIHDSDALIAS